MPLCFAEVASDTDMVEQQFTPRQLTISRRTNSRAPPRRICPLWLTLVLSAGVALLLVAIFPERHMKAKSIGAHSPSALSLAYLEAGLDREPESVDHLDVLAEHNLKLARWQEAIGFADRMESIGNDIASLQRALLMELAAAEQLFYALDHQDPGRQLEIL